MSQSQYVKYVGAGRLFERMLEQMDECRSQKHRLTRDDRWFETIRILTKMLADVRKSLPLVMPYLQLVTCRMCWLSNNDHLQGESSWTFRWKALSHDGYHVRKNQIIDYGNMEYVTIVRFLYLYDEYMAQCFDYLISLWPSLDVCPGPHLSSWHGVSMNGDVIEIYLAALRGERVFHDVMQERLDLDDLVLPIVYQHFNDLCKLVHFLNACLHTGCMKMTGAAVYRLTAYAEFAGDPFVQYWIQGDKALCLHALLF